MQYYVPHPTRYATYYPHLQKLTYYIGDRIQATMHELTERQARSFIYAAADGPREIVQILKVIPKDKI